MALRKINMNTYKILIKTIKKFYMYRILCFMALCILVSNSVAAKLDKINIVIETSNIDDKKLSKALETHKKILQEKTELKLVSHRKSYLESEGKVYLLKLLKSLGYYSGKVEITERESNDNNNIIFNVIPGPIYTLSSINILMTADSQTPIHKLNLPSKNWYSLSEGDGVIAKTIFLDEQRLQDYIENNNFLLSVDVYHEAIINQINHSVEVNYYVTSGALAHINNISFKGLETVNEVYTRKIVPIKDGDNFKISCVNESKNLLQRSGLFTRVDPIIPESTGNDGGIELQFKVKERQHRSVKAGVNYSTDLGPGITAGWEHRNLFSEGEKITTTLSVAKKEQELNTQFEKPFFMSDEQILKLTNNIAKKETLAYLDKGASVSAVLERKLSRRWIAGIGAKYAFNRIQDTKKVVKNFGLLSLPIYGVYDSRDDILNAKKGAHAKLETAPFYNTTNRNEKFLKNVISASTYFSADANLKPTLAIKGEYGVISGIKTVDNIPAIERFYAGGGGSIRGYGYQLVGPLNDKNQPIGGKSFIETSAELRMQIGKHMGGVIFADGGNVFGSRYGKINKNLVWGAGFGIRYYTDFAPLRVDIAFPVSKRRKIDKPFQLYFSIGQAF
jgi:translocation and assembly module TamA